MRRLLVFAGAAVGAAALGFLSPASSPASGSRLAGNDASERHATDDTAAPALSHTSAQENGEPVIVALASETWIHGEPSYKSPRLGYLKVGTVVRRGEAAGTEGCPGGWHRVEPRGYVCAGESASFDADHPLVDLARRDSLLYVSSRYPPSPLYGRLPSPAEQRQHEPDLEKVIADHEKTARKPKYVAPPPPDAVPELLAKGEPLPRLAGDARGRGLKIGRARVRSSFALSSTFDHEGRRFGLTTDMALIPLDRTRIRPVSQLQGAVLEGRSLPVAIVVREGAQTYRREGDRFRREADLARHAVVHLGSAKKTKGYLESADGSFIRARDAVVIQGFRRAPQWALEGKKWIDVSILDQTLVAYEGTTPVFATLVSTGADGIAPARSSLATKQGTFLVHTKHVTATMSDPEEGGYELAEVPHVQYFHEGYALHGAYWHDDFGKPRSHGCVNLAPADAAWLFAWTDPQLPTSWHGVLSLDAGTTVHIHP
jgi:hypothetical protein